MHYCMTVAFDGIALHDFVIGESISITFKISGVKSCFFPLNGSSGAIYCSYCIALLGTYCLQCLRTVIIRT